MKNKFNKLEIRKEILNLNFVVKDNRFWLERLTDKEKIKKRKEVISIASNRINVLETILKNN